MHRAETRRARDRHPRDASARIRLGRLRTHLLSLVLLALSAGCGRSQDPGLMSNATPPPPTPPATASVEPPVFEELAERAGITFRHQLADGTLDNIMESDGAGGAVLDFDSDGYMDLYLVNSGPAPVLSNAPADTPRWPNRLYRNRGNGTFDDVTDRAGVAGHGFGTTAAAADLDNDGDTDLLVVNFGSLILYQNQGDGTFRDVTAAAGLTTKQAGISAVFLDIDRDGFLDLFVANYLVYDPAVRAPAELKLPYPGPLSYEPDLNCLYRNRGNGTFEEIGERAGIRIPGHRAMSVSALDYDRDGDTDLYVSNDATPNLLLANDGQGRFKDVAMLSGAAFNQFGQAGGSMGAAVGDANGDGWPDLLVTRFESPSLYLNIGNGTFEDRVTASGILEASSSQVGWGGNFLDIENDGDLDLFIATGDPHRMQGARNLLLENQGDATFRNASSRAGPFFVHPFNARGSGVLDYDNDGRPDLVVTSLGDRAALLHNRSPAPHHWITLKLVGSRSNRDGFGARVQLVAGSTTLEQEARCPTSYVFQQDPRLHFGLGPISRIDRIDIRWSSGQSQTLTHVSPNQIVRIQEP